MGDNVSKRRMIENEVVFRQHNESIEQNFKALRELAKDANQEYLIPKDDTALHFYCECSDEDCRKRIVLAPSVYDKIHVRRDRFIILSGHDVQTVEKVVKRGKDFWVVEKKETPPATAKALQPTGVDNS